MDDKYEGMAKYICKRGHEKYVAKGYEIDICNICGSKEFTLVDDHHGHSPAVTAEN
jgi:hypothetical protein